MQRKQKVKKTGNERMSKYIIYSLGGGGGAAAYIYMGYLTFAMTEDAGMSALLVSTIFLISRVFDGVSDLIAGYVIDRTKTKWGKARPYDLANVFAWVALALAFSMPKALTGIGQIIWLFVMYNLYSTVFSTLSGCADVVRTKRSFSENGRATVISIGAIFTTVVCAIPSVILPAMIDALEGNPNRWLIISAALGIPCIIMILMKFFFVPEVNDEEVVVEQKEKISFIDMIKTLISNKYALIILFSGAMIAAVQAATNSINTYYFQYVIGDLSKLSVVSAISIVAMILVIFLPALAKKIAPGVLGTIGIALTVGGGLIRLISPMNLTIICIATAISGVGLVPMSYMRGIMLMDCMDYSLWKTGKSAEGTFAAVESFVKKIGNGLGGVLLGYILEMGHYDGNLTVQPDSALEAISFLTLYIPIIFYGIALVVMLFYNLDKKMPAIRTELKQRGLKNESEEKV